MVGEQWLDYCGRSTVVGLLCWVYCAGSTVVGLLWLEYCGETTVVGVMSVFAQRME